MHRWVRIFGDQYLGFWILGILLFAVQEIPYLLMPLLRLETNPIMNMTETSPILDACEKLFGSLCLALMIFVVILSVGRERKTVFYSGRSSISCQLLWLGAVFYRTSKYLCDDAFHSGHAAAVLHYDWSMAEKHPANCCWSGILRYPFRSCSKKSDQLIID